MARIQGAGQEADGNPAPMTAMPSKPDPVDMN
jgi:hypothetical protein